MNDPTAHRAGTPLGQDEPVAVIVVHGVADQPRGETADAVATQLALETAGAVVRRDVTLRVKSCKPAVGYERWDAQGLRPAMRKSFFHALRSDFLDPRLGGADSEIASGRPSTAQPLPNSAAADNTIPLGVRFTDFLIAKHRQARVDANNTADVAHTAARFDIEAKDASGGAAKLSVFEMYWADLSRLPGFVPQIVAELFTLLFDLVRIGGQAVGMYASQPGTSESLKRLARAHRVADQLYTRALATSMLQLIACALVVVLATTVAAHAVGVAYALSLLVAVGVAAWVARTAAAKPWVWGSVAGVVALALLIFGIVRPLALKPQGSQPVGIAIGAVVLLLAAGYVWTLRYWEKRFRAVLGYGIAFGSVTALCIAWGVVFHDGLQGAQGWLVGAMRAAEFVLFAQSLLWAALAVAILVVVGLGWWVGRKVRGQVDRERIRHVIRTGRLGVFASLGAFVVFVTAAWALVKVPLCGTLKGVSYPVFSFGAAAVHKDGCDWFTDRFVGTTETFALVALMLSLVIGFVVVVLAPCIAAEMALWRYQNRSPIGEWLRRGYLAMDRLLGWGSWVALAGLVIGALLLGSALLRPIIPSHFGFLDSMSNELRSWSSDVLQMIVIAVAGTTTGLLAIGRVTAKRLKALRIPLDAALDVDVHFREFPREAIPRVRIVERYVALLQHVVDQGFQRIVIVAHSQGTVITADLLYYLRSRPGLVDENDKRDAAERTKCADETTADLLAELGKALAKVEIDLLTVGCPLRQLYAQRFPAQYSWACNPDPALLGVRRWFNAWGAADYVGRWLWSKDSPLPLDVAPDAYQKPLDKPADRHDECIGPQAHTHYFEPDQAVVRRLLRMLLGLPKGDSVRLQANV